MKILSNQPVYPGLRSLSQNKPPQGPGEPPRDSFMPQGIRCASALAGGVAAAAALGHVSSGALAVLQNSLSGATVGLLAMGALGGALGWSMGDNPNSHGLGMAAGGVLGGATGLVAGAVAGGVWGSGLSISFGNPLGYAAGAVLGAGAAYWAAGRLLNGGRH